jgi:hypothetical protein
MIDDLVDSLAWVVSHGIALYKLPAKARSAPNSSDLHIDILVLTRGPGAVKPWD